jgi:predicted metal-dependent peptidase
MTESATLLKVRDARAGLLRTHPFFGVLALKLQIREAKTEQELAAIKGTAGVTPQFMMFSPEFVETLTNAELKGLIAHEVMHLALCHHTREGKRDPDVFNIACDFAINPILKDEGFALPEGGLLLDKYRNMSAEAIYEDLMKNATRVSVSGGGSGAPGSQQWGEFTAAGPDGSADQQASAREWAENAAEAMRAAKSAGKMPASIAREIEEALKPRADWKTILRRFMTDQVRAHATWSKPNKRFYPGMYLPGKTKTGMGPVLFIIDTSGSIDAKTLGVFEAEANAVLESCAPSRVYVIYCDAAVNRVDEFEGDEPMKLRMVGGGGTDFRPPFDHAERAGWPVACAIYLTDLMGTFPDSVPYDVLWASYDAGDTVAPLGETVRIDG